MSEGVVRRAVEGDIRSIAKINSDVFLGDRDRLEGARRWIESNFRAFPVYQYFVIEVEGVVAGYAGWQMHGGFHRAEPVIELDQIGVSKEYERRGCASQLMRDGFRDLTHWMQEANDRIESHVSFVVWVYAFNFNAISAYAKEFGDGIAGMRTQFGARSEIMLRRKQPLIRPVREE